jgi:hypothetical protein
MPLRLQDSQVHDPHPAAGCRLIGRFVLWFFARQHVNDDPTRLCETILKQNHVQGEQAESPIETADQADE